MRRGAGYRAHGEAVAHGSGGLAMSEGRAPLVVGLLGGIASGKSRVSSLLGAHGAAVLDADRLAHEELGSPAVRAEVLSIFGESVFEATSGEVDRRALGRAVFGDPARLRRLEEILHPRVMARIAAELDAKRAGPGEPRRVVVLDVPLLLEASGIGLCDEVVFIDVPLEMRLERVRERGWAEGELERRESRQAPLARKRAAAGFVIDNGGDLMATAAQVERFWRERIAQRITS